MKIVLVVLLLGIAGLGWLLFGPSGKGTSGKAAGESSEVASLPPPDVSGVLDRLPPVPEPVGTDGTLALDPACLGLFEACKVDSPVSVRQLLQRDPRNAVCYYMMAGCEMKQGRVAQAIALLEQGNRAPLCYWYAARAEDWSSVASQKLPHLQMLRQVGSDAKRAPQLGVRGLLAYRQAGLRICRATTPYPTFISLLVGGAVVKIADKHLPTALAKEGRQAQVPQFRAQADRFEALLKQTKDAHNASLRKSMADRKSRIQDGLGADLYAWFENETKAGRVPSGFGGDAPMPKESLSPQYWAIQEYLMAEAMAADGPFTLQAAKRF